MNILISKLIELYLYLNLSFGSIHLHTVRADPVPGAEVVAVNKTSVTLALMEFPL